MTQIYDYLIVGGGIAGASVAYHLAPHGQVLMCEMESQPGYHTTGRSAAFFAESYGNKAIRPLTICSKAFLLNPPSDFHDAPLMTPRGAIHIFDEARMHLGREMVKTLIDDIPDLRLMTREDVIELVPSLAEADIAGAVADSDCAALDVSALHQSYLKGFKRRGGTLICNAEMVQATKDQGIWLVKTRSGDFKAKNIVNSSGAWGDIIAERSGVKPIGLLPLKRTIITVPAEEEDNGDISPLVIDIEEDYYFKIESGRYIISPADETVSPACDIQPDIEDIAIAVDKFERATNIHVTKVENSWAGLRTFAPDRSPVIGYDDSVEGFFWNVGQGGYGIQTAPAWSWAAAHLMTKGSLPEEISNFGVDETVYSPKRFRAI